ncbi:MAG: ATP-dependent helicase [Clostridiales bacterium]|nr:ATP-dependent helicase [Clostridiales bacterium]
MLEKAHEILKKYYGYTSFRGGQEKVIESILSGNDTFVIMPTGAGKSICFQIPAMLLPGITVVISPLISLMKDQVDALEGIGIPASFINSSLTSKEVFERVQAAKNGETKILYIAPERLDSPDFLDIFKSLEISLIAVDEAHCVSQWGHDFRPSYKLIPNFIRELDKRPIVAAFTATATLEVKEDVINLLGLINPGVFVTGFNRENLYFAVVRDANKRDFILNYLKSKRNQGGIIYAATRREVDSLYEYLTLKGYSVGKYHAGMKDDDRKSAQENFLYDRVNIMIATNAFGMGIDKSNVRFVIHHNMPKNMEAYYQEAGRAGRDGDPGECILLFGAQDVIVQKYMIEQSVLNPLRKSNEYKKLQEVVDYCHTQKCIRKYILEYFGEEDVPASCGNCSTCLDDRELEDITLEAQMIISCVVRVRERYGTNTIADVLKGSRNKKILDASLNKLSTYGIMKHFAIKDIRDMINLLIAEDYLGLTEGKYPVVRLKSKAHPVLKGEAKVLQKVERKVEVVQEVDDTLFEVLRRLRKEIAEALGVPPYIVFSDNTLSEMCKHLPTTSEELLNIKGVGEEKLKRYGEKFIEAIEKYALEHGLELPHNKVEEKKSKKKDETPSHVITLNSYVDGKTVMEIAEERELALSTVQQHIIRCAEEGMDVDLSGIIPEKYEGLILDVIKKLDTNRLKPIKDELPDEVDYLMIKAVILKHKSDVSNM